MRTQQKDMINRGESSTRLEDRAPNLPYLVGMFLILFGSNFGQLLTKHFSKHMEMPLDENVLCRFIPFIIGLSIVVCKLMLDGHAKSRRDMLSWAWLLFGLYALVDNYYIPNGVFSYESTYCIFEVLVLLLLTLSDRWHESYLRVLVAISLVHAGCTLFFFIFPGVYKALVFPHVDFSSPPENYLSFMSGLGTHYSQNGIWLATGAAVTFAQFRTDVYSKAPRRRKHIDIVEVSIVVVALLLCGKRLHFVAAMILMMVVYFMSSSDDIHTKLRKVLIVTLVILGVMSVYKLVSSSPIPVMKRLEDSKTYEEAAGRINMWSYAALLWRRYPVFGVGFGGFMYHMAQDLPFLRTLDPHNTFLQLLSELGLIGFVTYILLMALTVAQACILFRKSQLEGGSRTAVFGIAYALGMLIFIGMYSFVGTPLAYAPQCSLNFFLAVAVLLYYGRPNEGIMAKESWHSPRFAGLSVNGGAECARRAGCESTYTTSAVYEPKNDFSVKTPRLFIGPISLCVGGLLIASLLTWTLTGGFGSFRFRPKSSIDDYSWADLAYISRQISDAETDSEAEAIERKFNLIRADGSIDPNNTKSSTRVDGTTIQCHILGFRHDGKSDGSGTTGITFCYVEPNGKTPISSSGSNVGGWDQSELRAHFNGDYLQSYTDGFVNQYIFEAALPANNVGETSDVGAVWTVPGRFWILSASEVYGADAANGGGDFQVIQQEGQQYQIFAEGGLDAVLSGHETWLRTSATFNSTDFAYIDKEGNLAYSPANESKNILVAFCL